MLTKGYGNKRESYSQVPPCVRATAGASNRHTHTHIANNAVVLLLWCTYKTF